MCATNVWAVNSAAYTVAFRTFTSARLGVAPEKTDLRIASERVRGSARSFTLTPRMCDCRALIGLRTDSLATGEAPADAWLGWIRDLPLHVPHLSRLAVLHAWSPAENEVRPVETHGVQVADVDEAGLRALCDDVLVTIDYPPDYRGRPRADASFS